MTIPELLVRDGLWPTTAGPSRNVTNVISIQVWTDHLPKKVWYEYNNRHASLQVKFKIYMPQNAQTGDHMYVGHDVQIIKRGGNETSRLVSK